MVEVGLGDFAVVDGVIFVGTPFPDIAMGVVDAPVVGLEAPERSGESETVAVGAIEVFDALAEGHARYGLFQCCVSDVAVGVNRAGGVSAEVACGRPCAGSVFPLPFGWKAVGGLFLSTKPGTEGGGVLPTDADNGMVFVLRETGVAPSAVRPCPELSFPFFLYFGKEGNGTLAVGFGSGFVNSIFNKLAELPNRDLGGGKLERLGNPYPVTRP